MRAFDDRFSGTDLGRQKSSYMLQRDGFLNEESDVWRFPDGRPDDGFMAFWHERRELQGMRTDKLEPNDPLGRDGVPLPEGQLFDMATSEVIDVGATRTSTRSPAQTD